MSSGNLPTPIRLLPLVAAQQIASQNLGRTPEPSSVTAADPDVRQYDRVMGTKLAVVYGAGLALLGRALPGDARRTRPSIWRAARGTTPCALRATWDSNRSPGSISRPAR